MNMIESYAHAVGKHLPARQRPDIEAEIRSLIEDMLDERSQQAGRPSDDEMVNEVLKELGDPEKLAASYLPTRYLIGPKLYPTFALVLKIVFIVLASLAVVGLAIRIGTGDFAPQTLIETILHSLGEYLGGAVIAFGNIVLVFAILERTLPPSEFEEEKGEWTPAELTKEPDPDHVSTWEPILIIVFTLAGLVILNFYPHIIGISFPHDGEWVVIPILSDAFFRVLPLINIAGVLAIALQVLLLRRGRWQTGTRWFYLGTELLSVVIAGILLTGPAIIALTEKSLAASPLPADLADLLVRILYPIAKVALVIAIVAGGAEVIKTLWHLFGKKNGSKPAFMK
jgi:hypothetical protein